MNRALSVDNVMKLKTKVHQYDGEWELAFNQPEASGVWFVYGASTSGKSSFVMQWAKYMTRFGKVLYNSLEEKVVKSFRDRMRRFNMSEVKKGRFVVVHDNYEALKKRLLRQRSAQIVVIDSDQYMDWTFLQYLEFKALFKNKTIMIVSQVEGRQPKSKRSRDIMFDAYIKVWVEGYRAISKGREIGPRGYYTVWDQGAEMYWGADPKPKTKSKSKRK